MDHHIPRFPNEANETTYAQLFLCFNQRSAQNPEGLSFSQWFAAATQGGKHFNHVKSWYASQIIPDASPTRISTWNSSVVN